MIVPTNLDEKLVRSIEKRAKLENRTRNNMIETLLIEALAMRILDGEQEDQEKQ